MSILIGSTSWPTTFLLLGPRRRDITQAYFDRSAPAIQPRMLKVPSSSTLLQEYRRGNLCWGWRSTAEVFLASMQKTRAFTRLTSKVPVGFLIQNWCANTSTRTGLKGIGIVHQKHRI